MMDYGVFLSEENVWVNGISSIRTNFERVIEGRAVSRIDNIIPLDMIMNLHITCVTFQDKDEYLDIVNDWINAYITYYKLVNIRSNKGNDNHLVPINNSLREYLKQRIQNVEEREDMFVLSIQESELKDMQYDVLVHKLQE